MRVSKTTKRPHGVPRSTWYCRLKGRPSIPQSAEQRRYLTKEEEQSLAVKVLELLSNGTRPNGDEFRNLAFEIKRRRLSTILPRAATDQTRPPGVNWRIGFYTRHPQVEAEMAISLGWVREISRSYSEHEDLRWYEDK